MAEAAKKPEEKKDEKKERKPVEGKGIRLTDAQHALLMKTKGHYMIETGKEPSTGDLVEHLVRKAYPNIK